MNPHLHGIAVTALLGKMWRALDQTTREHFSELSMQLRGTSPPALAVGPSEAAAPEAPLFLPRFGIQCHKSFGLVASEASAKLIHAT
jgi:hypothetical protein